MSTSLHESPQQLGLFDSITHYETFLHVTFNLSKNQFTYTIQMKKLHTLNTIVHFNIFSLICNECMP